MDCPTRTPLPKSLPRKKNASNLPTDTSSALLPTSGHVIAPVCELLLKLYPLRQQLIMHLTTGQPPYSKIRDRGKQSLIVCSHSNVDVLVALCASPIARLTASGLDGILVAIMGQDALWERKDADGLLSLTRLVQEGTIR